MTVDMLTNKSISLKNSKEQRNFRDGLISKKTPLNWPCRVDE